MKRLLSVGLLVLLSAMAVAQNISLRNEVPFQAGEWLQYSVQFKWGAVNTEVATANIRLEEEAWNGQDTYLLDMSARTASFFDVFYKVREHFQSRFDKENQRPLQCTRDTYESGYTALNSYLYDWENHVIHADINVNGKGDEHVEIPLQDNVYDLPTMVYRFRMIDASKLKEGDSMTLKFAIDEAAYDITLTFVGKEVKKIKKLGRMNTLRFACTVVSGELFEGNQPVSVWFSEDGAFLPVAFMAPLKVGAMWGWLKKYEGIKYPLEAKL